MVGVTPFGPLFVVFFVARFSTLFLNSFLVILDQEMEPKWTQKSTKKYFWDARRCAYFFDPSELIFHGFLTLRTSIFDIPSDGFEGFSRFQKISSSSDFLTIPDQFLVDSGAENLQKII